MLTWSDYKTPNENLFNKIQQVYSEYFRPDIRYTHGSFSYTNAPKVRIATILSYPNLTKADFFDGIRKAVLEAGNIIVFNDTFVLFTAKKPL